MQKYASFKNTGELEHYGNLDKTLAEIKTLREASGGTAIAITAQELEQLQAGYGASESGGVITIDETTELAAYKTEAKRLQKRISKGLFIEYRDDIGNSDADIATYKTSLKSYFISDVKAPINAASTKTEVDTAVAAIDWSSVVIP